jgi:hypothetical protein
MSTISYSLSCCAFYVGKLGRARTAKPVEDGARAAIPYPLSTGDIAEQLDGIANFQIDRLLPQ